MKKILKRIILVMVFVFSLQFSIVAYADDPHGGAEGVMAKDTSIDGYALWPSGAMVSAADIAARNLLDQIGWSLEAAFNWSTSFPYSSTSSTPAPGSEWFANYGFQNGTGDCYVKSATFYYMARQMGYDAHQVAGFVPTAGGGMEDHSWVEIGMEDGIYVFDPSYAQTGRNGYQIYYGMSGTWRYMNYYRMN